MSGKRYNSSTWFLNLLKFNPDKGEDLIIKLNRDKFI